MIVVDFLQFLANFIIAATVLRLLQIQLGDSPWGKTLAFIY